MVTVHDCADVAMLLHTRCASCGAQRVACAECSDDLTDHQLDPCPGA